MFESLKNKFLEYVDVPADSITENTEIIKDLQMNSFDIVTLIGDISEEYNITFEQGDIDGIVTVGDLAECIKNKIK